MPEETSISLKPRLSYPQRRVRCYGPQEPVPNDMGNFCRISVLAAHEHRSHPHSSGPIFSTCLTRRLRAALGCPPMSPAPGYRRQGHAAPAMVPLPARIRTAAQRRRAGAVSSQEAPARLRSSQDTTVLCWGPAPDQRRRCFKGTER